MNSMVSALTRSLTGKNQLSDCSIEELQELVNQYPVFAPAQLLLAGRLKETDIDAYEKQLQKTAAYFSDRLWVENLLRSENENNEINPRAEAVQPLEAELEKPATFEETVEQSPIAFSTTEETGYDETEPEEEITENNEPPIVLPQLKIEPIDPATAELSFEPYHTVDYFASQGIRFNSDEKPKDKFGQQLKSFTEWLKTMKKVSATELAATSSLSEEKKVEQMAEKSLSERPVITEAMAEVWEKQGEAAKALEIYKKLSLLDPSKSSYFAAKIEHLKTL